MFVVKRVKEKKKKSEVLCPTFKPYKFQRVLISLNYEKIGSVSNRQTTR